MAVCFRQFGSYKGGDICCVSVAGYSARCLNVTVSVSTTKLNLRVIVFVISWTRFSGFSDPKMGPFSGPKNGVILRPLLIFLTGRPKGEAGKWTPFRVVWVPKTRPRQVPSVADLAHGASPFLGATVCRPAVQRSFSMLPFPNS